ncbi:MAG: hypothetical protein HQL32_16700 [Planctomycetes bacterium]|nr:hypothetical protein [Planctomycetota bacterium]
MENLNQFTPKGKKLENHEQFLDFLMQVWKEKSKTFTNLKIKGLSAFTKESLPWQTASGWKDMALKQNRHDFFITNTLIFYDDITFPYPHAICKHAKLGGMDTLSPLAPNGGGSIAMVSTIGFTNIKPFGEGDIPKDWIAQVLGAALITHELTGHALVELPDFYDHPLHCIMCTPPENESYRASTENTLSFKGPCPKCLPRINSFKKGWVKTIDMVDKVIAGKFRGGFNGGAIWNNRVFLVVNNERLPDLSYEGIEKLFLKHQVLIDKKEIEMISDFINLLSKDAKSFSDSRVNLVRVLNQLRARKK